MAGDTPKQRKHREPLPLCDSERGATEFAAAQIGVRKGQVIKHEASLKVDRDLLVVHGNAEDQDKARNVLAKVKTTVAG